MGNGLPVVKYKNNVFMIALDALLVPLWWLLRLQSIKGKRESGLFYLCVFFRWLPEMDEIPPTFMSALEIFKKFETHTCANKVINDSN